MRALLDKKNLDFPSLSDPTYKPLKASKWMHQRVLLSVEELKELFDALGPFSLYSLSKMGVVEDLELPIEVFFNHYQDYLKNLKNREDRLQCKDFSLAMIQSGDAAFYALLKPSCYALRLRKPCIQISICHFFFDPDLKECFFNQHSKTSIKWGLQFSFPHFYEDPVDRKAVEHYRENKDPHTAMFKKLQRWIRDKSVPFSFNYEKEVIRTTLRLGKKMSFEGSIL